MNNIDIFKAISGLVFAQAYESFPLKIDLSPSEIAISLSDEFWDESQRQIAENQFEYVRNRSPIGLAKPTIEWLGSAGLITFDGYRDGVFLGVTLTAKGLESIESKEEHGFNLLSAVKDLAVDELKDQARKRLKEVFSEALSWSVEKSPTIIQAVSNYASQ
ncbi:hypothetical protein [Vibrio cionasavignyae]|uniref:hypothetical protein n=1 Tax=Vibrio cionasavignyae TaxID=2910252 RepID=UPI003D0BCEE0